MNFNRNYEAIEKLWNEKFANQGPKREEEDVLSRMKNLKTSFQNGNYEKALNITRTLFSYFVRIGDSTDNSLSSGALSISNRLWDLGRILESILEKKVKQPSGAVVYVY